MKSICYWAILCSVITSCNSINNGEKFIRKVFQSLNQNDFRAVRSHLSDTTASSIINVLNASDVSFDFRIRSLNYIGDDQFLLFNDKNDSLILKLKEDNGVLDVIFDTTSFMPYLDVCLNTRAYYEICEYFRKTNQESLFSFFYIRAINRLDLDIIKDYYRSCNKEEKLFWAEIGLWKADYELYRFLDVKYQERGLSNYDRTTHYQDDIFYDCIMYLHDLEGSLYLSNDCEEVIQKGDIELFYRLSDHYKGLSDIEKTKYWYDKADSLKKYRIQFLQKKLPKYHLIREEKERFTYNR